MFPQSFAKEPFVNIRIEFVGFPVIYDLFPEGPHPYSFRGSSLLELVKDLVAKHDPRVGESLLEGRTKALDPTVQITINRRFVLKEEIPSHKIQEGDHIAFLKLLAGG